MRLHRALLLLVLFSFTVAARAQEAEPRRVVLVDGTVIVGVVEDEAADPLVIRTAAGVEQRVPRSRVRAVTPLLAGRFSRLDPARTRLFLAPTARTLGSGAGRFSAYYLFPSVAYGIGERLDVSAGATVPAVSSEGVALALNLNAKGQVARFAGGAAALGGSLLVPFVSTEGVPGVGGTAYGVVTLGSDVRALHLGLYGVYGTDFEELRVGEGVALLLGLESQVSNTVKLITENYLVAGRRTTAGVLTGGARFFGDRLAADVAAALFIGGGDFLLVPVPYLGLSYTFGGGP